MMAHGELTAKMARAISDQWGKRGYSVLYDHDSSGENVGKIVSWFGQDYGRETQLSQIDIAIVEKSSDKVFALIEIEETNDKPKTFLGDVFGVLMGEHIRFAGKRELFVDKHTTLIVFGKSESAHEKRKEHLLKKVTEIRSCFSIANYQIGYVVIETFSDEKKLSTLMPSVLDRAFKGEL